MPSGRAGAQQCGSAQGTWRDAQAEADPRLLSSAARAVISPA